MRIRVVWALVVILSLAATAPAQTKVSGSSRCRKPEQQQLIAVGDAPGHAFSISQVKCTYTKPLEIEGEQTKEYVATIFQEVSGSRSLGSAYVITTMANGDTTYVRARGSFSLKDGVVQSGQGRWRYVGGTGKLKGIRGGGTYRGKGDAEGGVTYDIEGEYSLGQ